MTVAPRPRRRGDRRRRGGRVDLVALRALHAVHHHAAGGAGPRPPLPSDGGLVRGRGLLGGASLGVVDGRPGRWGRAPLGPSRRVLAAAACAARARRGSRRPPRRFPPARPPPPGQRALARPVPPLGLRRRLRLADRRRARHLHQDGGGLPDDRPGRADRPTRGSLCHRRRSSGWCAASPSSWAAASPPRRRSRRSTGASPAPGPSCSASWSRPRWRPACSARWLLSPWLRRGGRGVARSRWCRAASSARAPEPTAPRTCD